VRGSAADTIIRESKTCHHVIALDREQLGRRSMMGCQNTISQDVMQPIVLYAHSTLYQQREDSSIAMVYHPCYICAFPHLISPRDS
jgi:hypothetical protein